MQTAPYNLRIPTQHVTSVTDLKSLVIADGKAVDDGRQIRISHGSWKVKHTPGDGKSRSRESHLRTAHEALPNIWKKDLEARNASVVESTLYRAIFGWKPSMVTAKPLRQLIGVLEKIDELHVATKLSKTRCADLLAWVVEQPQLRDSLPQQSDRLARAASIMLAQPTLTVVAAWIEAGQQQARPSAEAAEQPESAAFVTPSPARDKKSGPGATVKEPKSSQTVVVHGAHAGPVKPDPIAPTLRQILVGGFDHSTANSAWMKQPAVYQGLGQYLQSLPEWAAADKDAQQRWRRVANFLSLQDKGTEAGVTRDYVTRTVGEKFVNSVIAADQMNQKK